MKVVAEKLSLLELTRSNEKRIVALPGARIWFPQLGTEKDRGSDGMVMQGHSALGCRARRRVMTEVEKTGYGYPWYVSGESSRVLGLGSHFRSVRR